MEYELRGCNCLVTIFKNTHNIEHLDVSENNIRNFWAIYFKRIIYTQNENRNKILWMYNLRNEKPPSTDYKKGLISLAFDNANIEDNFFNTIIESLEFDNYMKSISFRNNLLSEKNILKTIKILKKNKNITYFDLEF